MFKKLFVSLIAAALCFSFSPASARAGESLILATATTGGYYG